MPRDVPGFISCTSECNNSDWDIHLSQTACLEMCRDLFHVLSECNNSDWDIHLSQTACLEMCQDLFHALVSVTTLLGYSPLSDCMPRDVPGFISCTSECNNITEIFISLRLHA